jgi:hypothetical protein
MELKLATAMGRLGMEYLLVHLPRFSASRNYRLAMAGS